MVNKKFSFLMLMLIFSISILSSSCSKDKPIYNLKSKPTDTTKSTTGQPTTWQPTTGSTITVTTFAGTSVSLHHPAGLQLDGSGNLYIADAENNQIRKITATGTVSVFAGTGEAGNADGATKSASFFDPTGIAFDAAGNLFVADSANNVIRKISTSGTVSSIVLNVVNNGASGPLNYPAGVAVDKNGNIFYTNTMYAAICKISGIDVIDISTFSVGNNPGPSNGTFFYRPFGIAIDKNGNIYVADAGNHRICKLDVAGTETTIAGQLLYGNIPVAGHSDGTGAAASFNYPTGIAVDASGNMYVADSKNNRIRKITVDGVVTTIAGTGATGSFNGSGANSTFNYPTGIAVNSTGTIIYVADTGNDLIRKITLN